MTPPKIDSLCARLSQCLYGNPRPQDLHLPLGSQSRNTCDHVEPDSPAQCGSARYRGCHFEIHRGPDQQFSVAWKSCYGTRREFASNNIKNLSHKTTSSQNFLKGETLSLQNEYFVKLFQGVAALTRKARGEKLGRNGGMTMAATSAGWYPTQHIYLINKFIVLFLQLYL